MSLFASKCRSLYLSRIYIPVYHSSCYHKVKCVNIFLISKWHLLFIETLENVEKYGEQRSSIISKCKIDSFIYCATQHYQEHVTEPTGNIILFTVRGNIPRGSWDLSVRKCYKIRAWDWLSVLGKGFHSGLLPVKKYGSFCI